MGPLSAQEAKEDRDALAGYISEKFGPDQELSRGYLFYNAYFQYKGDPYLPKDSFQKGSMVNNGITYQNISLKYDCYSQLLVLEYSESKGRYNQLSLNSTSISSFTLGKMAFQRLSLAGSEATFYQVIRNEPLVCYIHWSRSAVDMDIFDRRYLYEFSSPSAEFHLLYQEQLYSFSGKKSFVAIFPESLTKEIKRYLRENSFSFKKVQPGEIEGLLTYVTKHLESQSAE